MQAPGREFVCRLKYNNDLPSIPLPPKLVHVPGSGAKEEEHSQLIGAYSTHSLIESAPIVHYSLRDNGLPLRPLSLGLFDATKRRLQPLDLQDQVCFAKLSKEADSAALKKSSSAIPSRPRPLVPWLRKTEYISSQSKQFGRHLHQPASSSTAKGQAQEPLTEKENEIAAILATFDHVKRQSIHTLKHPTNRELKAVEIIPVFPDFVMWPNKYDVVTYDGDPLSKDALKKSSLDETAVFKLNEGLVKVSKDEDLGGEEEVFSYFSLSDNSIGPMKEKRKRDAEGLEIEGTPERFEYPFVRDYQATIHPAQHTYFFEFRRESGGVFYHPIDRRIKLRRKRAAAKNANRVSKKGDKATRIMLNERDFTKQERIARRAAFEAIGLNEVDDDDSEDGDTEMVDTPALNADFVSESQLIAQLEADDE